ncbi:MAG: isochorismatase [Anaerolineaceae bacterium]|nr:MAG: isochorismatase [Anaerolineaceae bacterium]
MPDPDYYDPQRVGELYAPDINAATRAGNAADLRRSDADRQRVALFLVDAQIDFIHADGALSVPGALDDTRRLIGWMYDHMPRITHIKITLDSHMPLQIFHPAWWANAEGDHPPPLTPITSEQVERGEWRPLYDRVWSRRYVEILEEDARKTLMIWPYHALIGTPGHALVPALAEAVAYHSAARRASAETIIKGMIPQTEYYSAIEPEVKIPEHPSGDINRALLDSLRDYHAVYIAGQAKSHCVLETVASMMRYYDAPMIRRLHVLTDTMSSVAHPEIDFDTLAEEAFAGWAAQGLNLVRTTDGIL